MAIRRSLPLTSAIMYENLLTKAVQIARDHKTNLSKMLMERSLVRIDAPTLEKYLELYANDESITLNETQYKAIELLFALGHKNGFFDAQINPKDFMIPLEYTELRNS
jgi:1,4-dihydroxy-6-naphthoate synthase